MVARNEVPATACCLPYLFMLFKGSINNLMRYTLEATQDTINLHHSLAHFPTLTAVEHCHLILSQRRRTFARWCREFRLHIYLLHTIPIRCQMVLTRTDGEEAHSLFLFKFVVHFVDILHLDTMCHHLQRIDLARLDFLEQVLPVVVDWRLPIPDESNTTFHQRAC